MSSFFKDPEAKLPDMFNNALHHERSSIQEKEVSFPFLKSSTPEKETKLPFLRSLPLNYEFEEDKDDLMEIIEKQNREFYNRINPRNLKEARLIVSKYNWKHSLMELEPCGTHGTMDSGGSAALEARCMKFKEAVKNYLKKREEFLQLISEYL